jgi:hypothetical protein
MVIRLVPTAAGRTARALLEEELLDVAPSRGHPPVIRLTATRRYSTEAVRRRKEAR